MTTVQEENAAELDAARPDSLKSTRSFRDYFISEEDIETILGSFGYTYGIETLMLPAYRGAVPFAVALQTRLRETFPRVTLAVEISKREFLVAPILLEIALHFDVKIRSEYPLKVSALLKGTLDYLLLSAGNVVVIEAKQDDFYGGFKQLAAQLVAVDQWMKSDTPTLYGAVTIGNAWQFALLNRTTKRMTQDIHLLRVPDDLEELVRALVGMLVGKGQRNRVWQKSRFWRATESDPKL